MWPRIAERLNRGETVIVNLQDGSLASSQKGCADWSDTATVVPPDDAETLSMMRAFPDSLRICYNDHKFDYLADMVDELLKSGSLVEECTRLLSSQADWQAEWDEFYLDCLKLYALRALASVVAPPSSFELHPMCDDTRELIVLATASGRYCHQIMRTRQVLISSVQYQPVQYTYDAEKEECFSTPTHYTLREEITLWAEDRYCMDFGGGITYEPHEPHEDPEISPGYLAEQRRENDEFEQFIQGEQSLLERHLARGRDDLNAVTDLDNPSLN